MVTRRAIREAGLAVILVLGGWAAMEFLHCRPNRERLIGAMGDLRPGMTRDEVSRVLEAHSAARLHRVAACS